MSQTATMDKIKKKFATGQQKLSEKKILFKIKMKSK
jgi:hypothetical protein